MTLPITFGSAPKGTIKNKRRRKVSDCMAPHNLRG